MPATQPLAEAMKQSSQVAVALEKATTMSRIAKTNCQEIYAKKIKLQSKHERLRARISRLAAGEIVREDEDGDGDGDDGDGGAPAAPKGYRRKFVQRCPKPGCNGFVDNKYTCGLCSTKLCRMCRVVVTPEEGKHVCNEDTLASVRALAADTRPCPGCATPIFKIDGCDQMWCTGCHTTFSWSKGQEIQGAVHNPHYYQWVRQQKGAVPRTPGDDPCGGAGDGDGLPGVGRIVGPYRPIAFSNLHRTINEIRADRGYYQSNPQTQTRAANMLRAQFILGKLPQAEFKRQVFLSDRTQKRKNEVADVFRMFCTVGATILQRAAALHSTSASFITVAEDSALLEELQALLRYTNEHLAKIALLFSVTAYQIHAEFTRVLRHQHVYMPKPRMPRKQLGEDDVIDITKDYASGSSLSSSGFT